MELPFIGSIGGVFLSLASSFVLRVLTALGLSVVTYYGFSEGLDFFKGLLNSSLSGLSAEISRFWGI